MTHQSRTVTEAQVSVAWEAYQAAVEAEVDASEAREAAYRHWSSLYVQWCGETPYRPVSVDDQPF